MTYSKHNMYAVINEGKLIRLLTKANTAQARSYGKAVEKTHPNVKVYYCQEIALYPTVKWPLNKDE